MLGVVLATERACSGGVPADRAAATLLDQELRFVAFGAPGCDDPAVSASLPPSQQRLRDARATGLRPRSRLLRLASVTLISAVILTKLGQLAPTWIGAALERAFSPTKTTLPEPSLAALALVVVIVCLGAAATIFHARRHSRQQLGVDPDLHEIPPWAALGLCVTALALGVVGLRPALAGAARSVDVVSASGLWLVWSRWLGRGLLTLALVAVSVGVLERLVSARRLWQGLHLTRAQARARARARSGRARQG